MFCDLETTGLLKDFDDYYPVKRVKIYEDHEIINLELSINLQIYLKVIMILIKKNFHKRR